MIRFSALLLVLPLFAVACGSAPGASTDEDVNSTRQALEQGESDTSDNSSESVETVEVEEAAPLPLVAADAGAPAPAEAPELAPEAPAVDEAPAPQEEAAPAPVGDAGVAPEVIPEPPVPCTENDTRRSTPPNEHLIETCMMGEWVFCFASNCPFSPFWDPNGPIPQ